MDASAFHGMSFSKPVRETIAHDVSDFRSLGMSHRIRDIFLWQVLKQM